MAVNTIPLAISTGGGREAPIAWSSWRSGVLAAILLPLAIVIFSTPASGSESNVWYPVGGLSWSTPLDSAVSDLYDSGLGFNAAMGYGLNRSLRIELRLDWFRRTAHPAPQLAERAESRMTLTPFSLEAHFRLSRSGVVPYVLAGPSLMFSEERFRYMLLDSEREVLGRRTDLGAVAGAGLELTTDRIRARISLRGLFTGGDRQVLRSTGRTDARSGSASPSFWMIGFELQPW